MKLKLTGSGFENFTGQMGALDFVDGVSVGDVSPVDARRVAGVITAIWLDSEQSPNVAESLLLNQDTPASTDLNASGIDPIAAFPHVDIKKPDDSGESVTPVAPVESKSDEQILMEQAAELYWSEKELGEIADKEGIKGIRAIADPAGIKGNSVAGLISDILAANVKK